MKQKLRSRLLAICTALSCGCVMLLSSGVINIESYATTDTGEVSVIFTHDMHSHMDADRVSKDGKVVEVGGFGKLKTAMDEVRSDYPDSFVLDGGDFSMGTPYQTIFSREASELKMMKFLGYEATTFGNHEFDYRAKGLASMLQSAAGKGPQLLSANIDWEKTLKDESLKDDAKVLKEACDAYGVKDYTVLDHGGVKMAVFGLLGESAVEYAPESGLIFKDAQQTAKDVVNEIKDKEDVDLIVCISHCGTIENEADKLEESEDYQLAENVPDIDLIVSGHSHTTLDEPVQVGATYLVSCGSYNTNMGHVVLKKDGDRYKIKDYELVPLDESVKGDPLVEAELSKYRNLVDEEYFSQYGYSVSDTVVENQITFPESSKIGLTQGEEPLGNLLADSYKYAIMQAEKGSVKGYETGGVASGEVTSDQGGVQVTIVPLGVIRGSFLQGSVTVADAFNILSLGYGKDGQAGYPLVRAYLTGKELKAVAEVDASVSNFMGVARLYCSGLEYSWNPHRLMLNRAVDIGYNDGISVTELDDDQLYSVAADLYSCQMLGAVKDKSAGILKIEPKDAEGNPITNYEDHIIYDGDKEVKAWYAVASYLDSFADDQIPSYYSKDQGRKTEINSWSPVELLKQPNKIAGMAVGVVVILIAIAGGIVWIVKRKKLKKGR